MAEIIPAIIAKSQLELEEKINKIKELSRRIQLDIMDGVFVPNESLDFDFKLPEIGSRFEAHLMIKYPDKWVENNWKKVETILVPIESCQNPRQVIDFLKGKRKLGFALNPETSLKKIKDYLNELDIILIMTVYPGFYGAGFLPAALEKVKELRKLKPKLDIEVDGGINPQTIKMAIEAGANFLVSGSFVMNSQNPEEAIKTLEKLCQKS